MELPNVRNDTLENYLNKEDVIEDVVRQIMKDFAFFGINIRFSGNTKNAYQELHKQLIDEISRCLEFDSRRLLAIMYKVDISEEDLVKTTEELPHYNTIEVLAHQIIVRELKKILFRRYYNSKTPKE